MSYMVESETIIKHEGPSVDSNDPIERKLARRMRIERRVAKQRQSTVSIKLPAFSTDSATFEEEYKKFYSQIASSNVILEKHGKLSEQEVTLVKLDVHNREIEQRENKDIGHEARIAEIETKTAEAYNTFQTITDKWVRIKNYNDPYNITKSLKVQKVECDNLISRKDEIIDMLKKELKTAEMEYTREQRRQAEDINRLTHNIEQQIVLTKSAYNTQFYLISDLMTDMKKQFVDNSYNTWSAKQIEVRETEIKHSEENFKKLEQFQKKMSSVTENFEEVYRTRKFELTSLIDKSQLMLEAIKNTALLNNEKLDYNYQILYRREDENLVVKGQQKRRINKLQDVITDLRNRLHDYKTSTINAIKKRNEMIKKLQRSILDVESKADHFSVVNDKKFHQLWDINKNQCIELIKKIMDIDKILHEQQMAAPWDPPQEVIQKSDSVYSFRREDITSQQYETEKQTKSLTLLEVTKSEETLIVYKQLLKKVLMNLSDKSGFLTEKRLKMLISQYEDEQRTLVTLENIFYALGITNKKLLDVILQYFTPYSFCNECATLDTREISVIGSQISGLSYTPSSTKKISVAMSGSQDHNYPEWLGTNDSRLMIENVVIDLVTESNLVHVLSISDISLDISIEEEEDHLKRRRSVLAKKRHGTRERDRLRCEFNHPLVISCIFTLVALRRFVEGYQKEIQPVPTTGERLNHRRITASRELSDSDIQDYWKKIGDIYDDKRSKVWDALLRGLKYYHEVLKDRKIVAQEVCELREVNENLKKKLARYQDRSILLPPICHKSYSF